jgi:flagellar M-ring protein FliF
MGLRPMLLLAGIAAAVAVGVGVVLWSQTPNYNILFANLPPEDAASMTQTLSGAGIPYRIEAGSGAISVPVDRVNDARLLLAGQGLPAVDGFASMAKEPGFGVSQFMESARYQHALEAELGRTIASLQQVEAARVHIASPRNSSFVRDRVPGSASVFLKVRPGRRLSGEQVTSIVNLIASSVPELTAENVTVIDQQGRLLSSPSGRGDMAERDEQLEFVRQAEEGYAQRIETLLSPLVGAGRVRAQVSAQFDMSAVEETREQYRPDSQIVRSEQLADNQTGGPGGGTGGVPGALTNQPPEAGVAQAPGAQPARAGAVAPGATTESAAATAPVNSSREVTRNYEIDRTLAYSKQPGGRLQRLSVAVLIDNLRILGKDGKVTEAPLPPAQVERITALVKDAVGFNAERGDSVNVVNFAWQGELTPSGDDLQTIPLWEKPWLQSLVKIAAGLIVLLVLVFVVLRPLLRQLIVMQREGMQRAAAVGALSDGGMLAAGANSTLAYEQQMAQARTLVAQDPARVAQVVKTWVAKDE